MTTSSSPAWSPGEVPPSDENTAAFWAATTEHRFTVQACGCGHLQHPPRALCTACGSMEALSQVTVAGTGVLDSFTVVHRAPRPGVQVPYVIARVRLDLAPGRTSVGDVGDSSVLVSRLRPGGLRASTDDASAPEPSSVEVRAPEPPSVEVRASASRETNTADQAALQPTDDASAPGPSSVEVRGPGPSSVEVRASASRETNTGGEAALQSTAPAARGPILLTRLEPVDADWQIGDPVQVAWLDLPEDPEQRALPYFVPAHQHPQEH